MKKTLPLTAPGKDDARVRDKVRHEVNKYLKRARQKELPEGTTRWPFSCRLGAAGASAEPIELKEVGAAIDALANAGAGAVFIEIKAIAEAPPRGRSFPA